MKTLTKYIFLLGLIVVGVGLVLWLGPVTPPVAVPLRSANMPAQAQPKTPLPVKPATNIPTTTEAKPTALSAQLRYSEMNVLKANAYLEGIRKQDFAVILQTWIDADRVEHDPLKHSHLASTLSFAMRDRAPSPEFLAQMRAFIYDPANSKLDRGMLLSALGCAERKETLDMLLDMVPHPPDKELFSTLLASISSATNNRDESLSPTYEQVWRAAGFGDKELLNTIACSMARLGTVNGMEPLLTAALAPDGHDDMRKQAARFGLDVANILNDKAVPLLAERLSKDTPLDEASQLAGGILFRMQGVVANQALAAWIQSANKSAAPLALNLAASGQNPGIWEAALDPAVPYRSEKNREAIRAGLAAHRAGRVTKP